MQINPPIMQTGSRRIKSIELDVSLFMTFDTFNEGFCVYEHHLSVDENTPPELIYIGVCPVRHVMVAPDVRSNEEWIARTRNSTGGFEVKILFVTDNEIEAVNKRAALLREKGWPICNRVSGATAPTTSARRVVCIETGEVFNSASDAAKEHGLSAAQLSRHLQCMKGYKSVKGRHYSWS